MYILLEDGMTIKLGDEHCVMTDKGKGDGSTDIEWLSSGFLTIGTKFNSETHYPIRRKVETIEELIEAFKES